MNYLSENILARIYELSDKCFKKLESLDEEFVERNINEYIIMRNYIQKQDYYLKELAKATNKPEKTVQKMVHNLGFIRFKNRRLLVNRGFLNWTRRLIKDFIVFLNYPLNETIDRSIEHVNWVMTTGTETKNYKIVLLNAFESEDLALFPKDLQSRVKEILKGSSWGMCMYYFKELYSIYTEAYPELTTQVSQSEDTDLSESEEGEIEGEFGEEQLEAEISLDIQELYEQNQKLSSELNESRAVCDFLTMQYDDLIASTNKMRMELAEQGFKKVFLAFNSIENNKVLDTFFIAKSTLDSLKRSGWEPPSSELKSILFLFDLLGEFFNRQELTSRYKLGEEVTITPENVSNFEYKGQELKEGMKIKARVRAPAWYYKGNLLSKASVLEIKEGEKK